MTINQNHQVMSRPPLPAAAMVSGPPPGVGGLVGLPRLPAVVFAGRQDALERVHAALADQGSDAAGAVITQTAVHGLGGIGKSELALQYAAAHRAAYRLVWWIDADSRAQIQTGLAALTRALCAGTHSVAAFQATTEEAAAWAMSWLSLRTGWLLIFDNVEQVDDLQPYLSRLNGGSVLITSRRDIGWSTFGCIPIDLDVLDSTAATAVLVALIGLASPSPSEMAELAALAEEVGFLPLALGQSAAYIARTPGMTVPAYRHLLHTAPARAHAASPAGQQGQAVVAQVWTLTRRRIADLDPLAPHLLALLACYAPDQLPITVLHRLPDTDELQIGQALGLLASYSMITISKERDALSVHRLVQAVTLAELPEEERQAVLGQAADLLTAALPQDQEAIGSWPIYRRLLAHARAALPPRSEAMDQMIAYLNASGDYTTVKILQHQRYQAQLDHHGPEHPDTLLAQASLAYYTRQAGDAAAARDQLAALLPIHERVLGAEHPETLTNRANLAYLLGSEGDAAGARDQYAALLPIRERVQGAEHPATLTTRANLARWTGQAGDPAGARDQYAALLPIRERVSGAEHPATLISLHNLASWSGEAGDPAGARDQYAALLPIRERVSGAEHPTTLDTQHNLAHWSGVAGDAAGARDQLAVLLPIRVRVQGVEHPSTLDTLHELARWSGEAGDPAGARDQLAVLLPIRERVQGAEHSRTLAARHELARWSGRAGDPAGARDQYAALVPIRERVLGAEHPDTLSARHELAYWTQGCQEDPLTGADVVAFVTYGKVKLANLRTRPRLAVSVRSGWRWVTLEGTAEIIGPDDPHPVFDADGRRLLLREIYVAAGGTHDDWDEYDTVMAAERRAAVLVRPERIYGNT
ncbi:tetratricopeptide repeat protein [Herbidospora sp. NEAU-GS84]|uniref:Tetratricopeptide repeat protein n=1 Tax=Herbidospora solisilvae TaxID=2696284 RepID=A0A7C9MY34_9ACTN|nr:tetratricopeptide repeat protein [Herbidospora solisilvae]NAS20089.1 tetratricopeptide repeat protein [Herbidospora solisilvae]